MTVHTYQTLATPATGEFKDKGSRFLAFAYPVGDEATIKQYVAQLKEAHHKARHWCFAWRLGVDGLRFRANDDGEPSGSAGRPILGQMDSAGVTNTLVVVVRYFGGTLLGVPGLIHAYKTAAAMALMNAQIITKEVQKSVVLHCSYAHLSEAMRIARQFQAIVVQQDLQLDCRLQVQIPLAQLDACLAAWAQTRAITIENDA